MFMYGMMYYKCLWRIWNGDQNIVSLVKDIQVLRLLGCALFEDLSRRRYSDYTDTFNHIDEGYQVVRVERGPFNRNCNLKELVTIDIWIYLVIW